MAEILVDGWRWAYVGIISDDELAALDVTARMRRLEQLFDPSLLYVAAVDENDIPIGFAIETRPPQLPGYDCEIGGLYVDPSQTRSGVGRALVEQMVQAFRARGAKTMAIHTLQQNEIGRAFYQRIGGTLVHEDQWRNYPAVWYGWPDIGQF